MHFCLTGQYTPRAINNIMENPTTNRLEAAKKLVEAAGGKLISMYSTPAEGPGVLVIFDVPDPSAAPAIVGVVVAAGTLQNVKLTRLLTQDEVVQVRQKAAKLRAAYTPPEGSQADCIASGGVAHAVPPHFWSSIPNSSEDETTTGAGGAGRRGDRVNSRLSTASSR